MAVAWLAVLFLFDVPHARLMLNSPRSPRGPSRRLLGLARTALPLGIVTTVASVNLQIPRYFVHARMGDRSLGIFSALAYTTVAMTLVGDSLGQCVVPRLSSLFAGAHYQRFRRHIRSLVLLGCATGVCGVAAALLFGARVLRVLYSPEYAAHSKVFILLAVAAAIQFVASMLTTSITAARHFAVLVPMYVAMAACTALGCARWIPAMGLQGAALAVISGAVVRLTVAAGVVRRLCGGHS